MSEVEDTEQEALQQWLALPIAREVFRGSIGQKELYRRMNEVAKQRQELEEWYEQEAPKNEALIAERDELRAQLETLGSGGPPPSQASGVQLSAKDLDEIKAKIQKVEVLDRLLPAVLGSMGNVYTDMTKNGFDVDPNEVIQVSLQQGVEPWQAYLGLTADERAKRAEKAQEEERKRWFEEGRRAALTNSPDHLQPSGPSVVDYLQSLNSSTGAQNAVQPLNQAARVSAALKELSGIELTD